MRRHLNYEISIKEHFTYEWICPICGEENQIRVSIPKVFLPCPVCNVTFRRGEVSAKTWILLTDRQEKENRIEHVPELDLTGFGELTRRLRAQRLTSLRTQPKKCLSAKNTRKHHSPK